MAVQLLQLYSLNVSRCNYLQNSRMNPLFMEALKAKWGHIIHPDHRFFKVWCELIPLLCLTLELVPQFYFHLWKKKISENSKNTFSHWFHTWKKHILSRKMMSSEDFFVLFFMWETKCGNKKKSPGYPKKNISSLIQTWKQKLIYKTFHLVSRFVFHVWNRIYTTTLLHVWKTKWKKSLCKRKPFFFS